MKNFGIIVKEAEQFRQVRDEFAILVKLTRKHLPEILRKADISATHFNRIISNPEKLKAEHINRLLRAIIEEDNYQIFKTQSNGERKSECERNAQQL